MRLVEMEAARQDWKGMLCGCGGSAEHLARDLLRLAGEGTDAESARRGLDLPELCRNVAAQGLWLLYGEVMANRSLVGAGTAFEILTVVEPDRARLHRVRELAADWLPVCCRTGLCDDDLWALDR
ncbi:hypothetical protein ACFY4B_23410 [Kitasatospora sp. NPDC001261]|uniref:hypothetical protein n=1 Tax=Kitasatospora sp. NPDC001261 TaxID=3364012 RepID=UPI0036A7D46D